MLEFHCLECGTYITFDPNLEDPTTQSGACKVCGSHKWVMDNLQVGGG